MSAPKVIQRFIGNHAFLSNFFPWNPRYKRYDGDYSFTYNRMTWKTREHAYQASKCAGLESLLGADLEGWFNAVRDAESPGTAKRIGRKCPKRADFDSRRTDIMREVIKAFLRAHPIFIDRLLETKDAVIVEGNLWHDNFWGQCECVRCGTRRGENHLGRIWMEIRESAIGGKLTFPRE